MGCTGGFRIWPYREHGARDSEEEAATEMVPGVAEPSLVGAGVGQDGGFTWEPTSFMEGANTW